MKVNQAIVCAAGTGSFLDQQANRLGIPIQDFGVYALRSKQEVSIAGRMMSKRGMGKASFCDVQDRDEKIQIYVKSDLLGKEQYEEFKIVDIGDIVGVKGIVFKTHKGEISIKVEELILLSKS